MRIVLVAPLVASCATVPSYETIARNNRRASDAALTRAQADFGGTPFSPTTIIVNTSAADQPTPLVASVKGQGPNDRLYRLGDGSLGIAGQACAVEHSCGCAIPIEYRYLTNGNGRVAVVRLVPDVKTYRVKVDSCSFGCGVPNPSPPLAIANLGPKDPGEVEVIEQRYLFERRIETCDHPRPQP